MVEINLKCGHQTFLTTSRSTNYLALLVLLALLVNFGPTQVQASRKEPDFIRQRYNVNGEISLAGLEELLNDEEYRNGKDLDSDEGRVILHHRDFLVDYITKIADELFEGNDDSETYVDRDDPGKRIESFSNLSFE